ncbi:exodeoxyribonuclease V subunit beta [Tamilnaduibacter salinus]|uniref:RecBCD enzyme subunit RecB n=1 Tax=Tamilnaduibacter salinus TaxID=1484056 RepID=A0A2A2I1B5_9GAMM|nr:exodeoxyribonuclease V subunit beta [Tamilnaduibacter salinus]PAV25392.1 exodeoxyribonuclease V subunit beta [Tamilnaduibacter salinus]
MTDDVRPLDLLRFPLHGSRLIEASAGTGKTFTIALLYVRLVLGHRGDTDTLDRGWVPPEILVVTFTEAATRELRDRIRARLTEAAACFAEDPETADRSPGIGDPLLALRNDIPAEQWRACVRKLQLAAEWMDEAAVATIHGWCHRMLNEHAFDSGSFFLQTLETDQSELLAEAVRDYWRTHVYPLDDQSWSLLNTFWDTPDALSGALGPLLDQRDALTVAAQSPQDALSDMASGVRELKTRWRDLAPELSATMDQAIQKKAVDGRKLRRDWWANWFDALNGWSESADAILPDLSASAWKRLTPEGIAEILKTDSDLAGHEAWALVEQLGEWWETLKTRRAPLLVHATHWVGERLASEKQRRAEMGFDDLLTGLDDALAGAHGERLASVIRRQFPMALIDEFQDTDPVQYRIFNRVYRVAENDADTGLFLIGDPKQAIYAFRGADIHAYLTAREATAGRHYSLATNFRSADGMVGAVNTLFGASDQALAAGAFLFRRGDRNPLPFLPVAAKGRSDRWQVAGEPAPALTVWHFPEEDAPLPKNRAEPELAEACASRIVELLQGGQQGRTGFEDPEAGWQPVRARDVAVLVNKGSEARLVRDALARRGVRSVYLSDRDSVLNTAVSDELARWLNACAEPETIAWLRSALATPTLGLSDAMLDHLQQDELALEDTIERFRHYRALWQAQGVLPMLRRLLMDYQVPARLLAQPDGERVLTDILHLAEVLQQESQHLDGEHALIRHFADMKDNARGDAELLQVRLESDASLVQVVTVHKSKGLEYPLVFLPFPFNYRPEKRSQSFIKWHDDEGRVQVSLDPDDETLARADRERLGEDIRKLYVALTRACHATWVGTAPVKGWPLSGLGHLLAPEADEDDEPVEAYLRARLGDSPDIRIEPLPDPVEDQWMTTDPVELGEARVAHRDPRENWWIASYSALRLADEDEPTDAGDSPEEETAREETDDPAHQTLPAEPDSPHGFPRGADPGTFLHGLLEWCAERGFDRVPEQPDALGDMLTSRCEIRGWDAWVPVLQRWVLTLLNNEMPTPWGVCRLRDLRVYQPELEFWFESHHVDTRVLDRLARDHTLDGAPRQPLAPDALNGMLKGFIDLVFEVDGRFYVLDYKSNALGDQNGDYTAQTMTGAILDKRYDLQYLLYLLALHRLLKARLPDYDYERHVGGAIYLFLRGCDADSAGVFHDRPSRAVIESLDRLFRGVPVSEVTA